MPTRAMRDMICKLLRGDDKKRDEMRAGVRVSNDASKRIRDMTRDVRGVRARSARILIISLMIVSPSCLSLMISTRKSTLSLHLSFISHSNTNARNAHSNAQMMKY